MISRINIDSQVSTECRRFDKSSKEEERWSFHVFGNTWRDERLHGTVTGRNGGDKWVVRWGVDHSETE